MATTPRTRRLVVLIVLVVALVATTIIARKGILQVRQASTRLKCAQNLQAFGEALLMYGQGLPGPDVDVVQQLVAQGLLQPTHTVCPTTGQPYRFLSLPPVSSIPRPTETVVAYEPMGQHDADGAMVFFADGHAAFVPEREFAVLMAKLPRPTEAEVPPRRGDDPAD